MEPENKVSSRRVYDGRIVSLRVDRVALPGGGETEREVVEHPGGVAIVALDDRRNVLMVRQYRYAIGSEMLELPAGTREPDEPPDVCAVRELEEETGYRAAHVTPLYRFYPAPGYTGELLHIYVATGLIVTDARPEADERIQVVPVPWEEALAMVTNGQISDAKTIVGLLVLASRQADRLA